MPLPKRCCQTRLTRTRRTRAPAGVSPVGQPAAPGPGGGRWSCPPAGSARARRPRRLAQDAQEARLDLRPGRQVVAAAQEVRRRRRADVVDGLKMAPGPALPVQFGDLPLQRGDRRLRSVSSRAAVTSSGLTFSRRLELAGQVLLDTSLRLSAGGLDRRLDVGPDRLRQARQLGRSTSRSS